VVNLSTTLTYAINYYLSLGPINVDRPAGPVVAASLIGSARLLFKGYVVASYIAAFVGISAKIVISSHP
jgi:hypothetical protein